MHETFFRKVLGMVPPVGRIAFQPNQGKLDIGMRISNCRLAPLR